MDPFNKVLEYIMAKSVERCFIHNFDELWEYETIMKSDFPILKNNGFSFATLFTYKDGTCFVYGHYKRAYAIRQAINDNGRAYCLKDNKRIQ